MATVETGVRLSGADELIVGNQITIMRALLMVLHHLPDAPGTAHDPTEAIVRHRLKSELEDAMKESFAALE